MGKSGWVLGRQGHRHNFHIVAHLEHSAKNLHDQVNWLGWRGTLGLIRAHTRSFSPVSRFTTKCPKLALLHSVFKQISLTLSLILSVILHMFVSPLSNQSFHQGSLKFYNDPTPLAWRQTRGLRGSSWSGAPWAWRPSWRTSTPSSPWSGCANAATVIHHEKSNHEMDLKRPINIFLEEDVKLSVSVWADF